MCLRDSTEPRAVAADARRIREIQRTLVHGAGGPGVLLWPYHDLPPEHPAFEAANLFTVAGIWRADADSVFFQPEKALATGEWNAVIERAPASERDALREQKPLTRADAVAALARIVPFQSIPLAR